MKNFYFLTMCGQSGCLPDFRQCSELRTDAVKAAKDWAMLDDAENAKLWKGFSTAARTGDVCFYGGNAGISVIEIFRISKTQAINDGWIDKDGNILDVE